MLKNYFRTAYRNFLHNKIFAFINIFGLATGISSSLVIYLIVSYDFSFDKFEKDGERIYRVVSNYNFSGQVYHNPGVPHAMPLAVKSEIPGLDIVAPFRTWNDGAKVSVSSQEGGGITVYWKEKNIAFVDENYFKLLAYEWLAGSPAISLLQPYQIVLTEANAKRYFPKLPIGQVIGKEVIFNDTVRTTVTGIVNDISSNTDFTFRSFISRATIETPRLKPGDGDEWGSTNPASQLFVKLTAGTTARQTEERLSVLFKKYYSPDEQASHVTTTHSLQPLSDLHFNKDYDNFDQRLAHKPTLYGLLVIAAFLIILGSINFINLTTAQASKRAKEIGVRKTMGSSKTQLIVQFLVETFLLTLASTLLSLAIIPLLLQAFADFIPAGVHVRLLLQPDMLLFLLSLLAGVSLLSGIYPALILSSYKPVLVIKNQVLTNRDHSGGVWLRKSLTVFQFVVAQVFIIATIFVSKQINYTLNKDLGFRKDAIIYFNTNYNDQDPLHRLALMNKLKAIPEVAMISMSNTPPSSNSGGTRNLKFRNGETAIETEADKKFVDTSYIKLYKMKILAGTNLPVSDTMNSLIINETFMHKLGFNDPQQAIGKYLEWDKGVQYPVIGVIADFHQKSLHERIKPLVLASQASQALLFSIALKSQNEEGADWRNAIGKIEKAFKEVYPNDDFEYSFMDESLARYYTAEQDTSRLLTWAMGLSVFISCLGLLGLVNYVTNQKTREIGIRKVLGATVAQIISLLSKDFLQLIIIAFIIAVPVATYCANKWLESFAYKTAVSWWIFLAGGSVMILVAMLILGLRTFNAAIANPVKSLRTE